MTIAERTRARNGRRRKIMSAVTSCLGPIVLGLASFLALLAEQRNEQSVLIRMTAISGGAALAALLYRRTASDRISRYWYLVAVISVAIVWLAADKSMNLGIDEDRSAYIVMVWSRFWFSGAAAFTAWFAVGDKVDGGVCRTEVVIGLVQQVFGFAGTWRGLIFAFDAMVGGWPQVVDCVAAALLIAASFAIALARSRACSHVGNV